MMVEAPPFGSSQSKGVGGGARRLPPRSELSLGGRDGDPNFFHGTILYNMERNTKRQMHLIGLVDYEPRRGKHKQHAQYNTQIITLL